MSTRRSRTLRELPGRRGGAQPVLQGFAHVFRHYARGVWDNDWLRFAAVTIARVCGTTQSAGLHVVVIDEDVEAWSSQRDPVELFDPWAARGPRRRGPDADASAHRPASCLTQGSLLSQCEAGGFAVRGGKGSQCEARGLGVRSRELRSAKPRSAKCGRTSNRTARRGGSQSSRAVRPRGLALLRRSATKPARSATCVG